MFDLLADFGRELARLFRVACLGVITAAVALTAANARIPETVDRFYYMLSYESPPSPARKLRLGELAFDEPVPGYRINSAFGLRQMPWEPQGRLHAGVDIAAPYGKPVQAIAEGVVVKTGEDGAYGTFVELRHAKGGLTSLYAHLSGRAGDLQPGDNVGRGQVIGFVGASGHATGAHLHLEIRKGRAPLDPAQFLGRSFRAEADLPIVAASAYPSVVRMGAAPRAKPPAPAPASPPALPLPPIPDGVRTLI